MKYTFLIISVLLAAGLCAQVDTTRELPKRIASFADRHLQGDSSVRMPRDTFKLKSAWNGIAFKNNLPYYWNGSKWEAFTGGSGWGFSGDAISSGQFIGTTNAQDFVIKTGTGLDEVMRFSGDGLYKITMGYNNTASGSQGIAIGGNNTASGNSSLVFGNSSTASGLQSISLGSQNTASGTASTTIGAENIASGNYSFATGYKDTASALYSAVFGGESKASGNYSFAQGHESIASGVASIAMGNGAVSTGYGATTFGKGFTNAKDTSFAVGFTTRKLEVSPDSVIISPAVGLNVTANKVDMFNSAGKRQLTFDPNNGYWALGDWAGDYGNATSIHIADSIGEVRIDGHLNVQEVVNESTTDLSYPLWYNDLSQDFTAGTGVDSIWRFNSDSIRFRVRSAIVGKAGTFGIYAPASGGGSVSSASGAGVSLVNGSSAIKRLKGTNGITVTDNTDSVTVSGEWTRVSISSDQTTSSTTGTNITGLSFSVSSNTKYEIRAVLVMETNASTTGYGVGFTFPASCTGSCRIIQPNDNTSVGTIYNGLFSGVPNPTASNVAASSSYADATVHSMLNVAGTSGTVQFQFHSENGAGGTATVKSGSYLEYRVIQ